jgi:hypothetical protein
MTGNPFHEKINFESINHIRIPSTKALNNCVNYFPNVTDLTLEYDHDISYGPLEIIFNRVIPLAQITKLLIECHYVSSEALIKLLHFAPNMHTLKLYFLLSDDKEYAETQHCESFRLVSNTNIIKNVILSGMCTLIMAQFVIALCPRLDRLTTGIDRTNFESIVRILLSKTNNNTHQLFFLRITRVPKLCIRQLKKLIKSERILDDYLIDYVNRDLYLWC